MLLELDGSPLPSVRLKMVSLVVLRTPFFTSSFFKSAFAAGPTVGAVNIVMTLSRATSRTSGSESSNALTSVETHARNGNVGHAARNSVMYNMLYKGRCRCQCNSPMRCCSEFRSGSTCSLVFAFLLPKPCSFISLSSKAKGC